MEGNNMIVIMVQLWLNLHQSRCNKVITPHINNNQVNISSINIKQILPSQIIMLQQMLGHLINSSKCNHNSIECRLPHPQHQLLKTTKILISNTLKIIIKE